MLVPSSFPEGASKGPTKEPYHWCSQAYPQSLLGRSGLVGEEGSLPTSINYSGVVTPDRECLQEFYRSVKGYVPLAAVNSVFAELLMPTVAKNITQHSDLKQGFSSRFAHTRDFLRAMVFYGPTSALGKDLINRVNAVHDKLAINPENPEFHFVFYTLSSKLIHALRTLCNQPILPTVEREWYRMWQEAAPFMGASLPASYRVFKERSQRFEQQSIGSVSSVNIKAGRYVMESIAERIPAPKRVAVRFITAMIDPQIVAAFQFPSPGLIEKPLYITIAKGIAAAHNLKPMKWPIG